MQRPLAQNGVSGLFRFYPHWVLLFSFAWGCARIPQLLNFSNKLSFRINLFMVTHVGHLATIHCKPRQARKGATVVMDSCAEERRAWVATYNIFFLFPFMLVCGGRF